MKQNDIIRMAHEAGGLVYVSPANLETVVDVIFTPETIERFTSNVAAFAAEKEREACAQTCEERHANGNYQHDTRHECAEAIRNRGKETK